MARGEAMTIPALVLLSLNCTVLALSCTAAHAQPSSWQSYELSGTRYYSGTDQDGGQWTGNSYEQSGTTFSEFNGPHGQSQHCRSWQQGWQTFTECDR